MTPRLLHAARRRRGDDGAFHRRHPDRHAARRSDWRWCAGRGCRCCRQLVAAYVSLLRATPLVTLILLVFFGAPTIGLPIDPIPAAILTLTLNTSAFNCEIWRAALIDFPRTQLEAARAFGMSTPLALPTDHAAADLAHLPAGAGQRDDAADQGEPGDRRDRRGRYHAGSRADRRADLRAAAAVPRRDRPLRADRAGASSACSARSRRRYGREATS